MTDAYRKLAKQCREAAEAYNERPGLAGPGVNVGVIMDLYLLTARLCEIIADERTARSAK